jgi:MFS family permease
MLVNSSTTILYMITLPFFGKLADKISITKSMMIASILVALLSYPLISLISYDNIFCIVAMKASFALLAAWFCAPFYAWMHSLFHTKDRYTSISLSYSLGGQLGGSMVPLTLWLWKYTESLASIYGILIAWASIATISLYYSKYLNKHD